MFFSKFFGFINPSKFSKGLLIDKVLYMDFLVHEGRRYKLLKKHQIEKID